MHVRAKRNFAYFAEYGAHLLTSSFILVETGVFAATRGAQGPAGKGMVLARTSALGIPGIWLIVADLPPGWTGSVAFPGGQGVRGEGLYFSEGYRNIVFSSGIQCCLDQRFGLGFDA